MTAYPINAATLACKKVQIEGALDDEINHHLGYPPGMAKSASATNQRNRKGAKTVLTEDGPIRSRYRATSVGRVIGYRFG